MNHTQLIYWAIVVASTIWVGTDSSNLGFQKGRLGGGFFDMSTAFWVISCLLIWIIAFPLYFVARSRYRQLNATYAPGPIAYAAPYPAAAPPQASPDGQWWWTGQQWVPMQAPVTPVPPPAF